jgi:hypothetical protein
MMAYLLTGLVLGVLLVAADWAESIFDSWVRQDVETADKELTLLIACVALWPLVLIGLVVDWCRK